MTKSLPSQGDPDDAVPYDIPRFELPAELWLEVFSCLDYKTLKDLMLVCKRFTSLLYRTSQTSSTALDKALFRDKSKSIMLSPALPPEFELHPFLRDHFKIAEIEYYPTAGYIPVIEKYEEPDRYTGKYGIENVLCTITPKDLRAAGDVFMELLRHDHAKRTASSNAANADPAIRDNEISGSDEAGEEEECEEDGQGD